MTAREITKVPSAARLYAKAAMRSAPGVGGTKATTVPDLELVIPEVKIDTKKLGSYAKVCGFELTNTLPATYGFILGFPLHLLLMTDKSWPFAAIGSVHVDNTINQFRPIGIEETLTVKVRSSEAVKVRQGRQFGLLTSIFAGEEKVWDSTSNILIFGGGTGEKSDQTPEERPKPIASTIWDVPENIGRKYGLAAGDVNPIHIHAVTARPLGFPRAIAHGMWAKAKAIASVQSQLPEAFEVYAKFRKPILLPAQVGFGSTRSDDGSIDYILEDAQKRSTFQTGVIKPL